jgi:hypothetical protein
MKFVKKIKKVKLGQEVNNAEWWRSRPPSERWEAMLKVREQAWYLYCLGKKIQYQNDRPFQKIYKITKRA